MKPSATGNLVIVHMRNDLSGSTRVLAHSVRALHAAGFHINLYYADAEYPGFLSDLPTDIVMHPMPYKRLNRRWQTFGSYAFVQLWLFFALFQYLRKPATLYVSTVLPFGAALAGWLMRKRVVYHVHEISLAPAPSFLKKWLFTILKLTATKTIAVSDYLAVQLSLLRSKKSTRVYNALSPEFFEKAKNWRSDSQKPDDFKVLMVCSLAKYKGVDRFIALARSMPDVRFELLLNATEEEIDHILSVETMPACLTVYSAERDVHPFYQKASLLLNLSHVDLHIETFGMTVLEGMAYGLPSIVPTVGGVAELVEDQVSGYHIDSSEIDQVRKTIYNLKEDNALYDRLSKAATKKASEFGFDKFNKALCECFVINVATVLEN